MIRSTATSEQYRHAHRQAARKNPRELAQALVAALPESTLVSSAEVAGAGFINFRVAKDAWFTPLKSVAALGAAYGRSNVGAGRKVMIEFVSANPTGPLHVGHGRGAAYGATLGNLLEATGHSLYREFYVNDAGRQIDILAVSVYLRYSSCAVKASPSVEWLSRQYILPTRRRCTNAAVALRDPRRISRMGLRPMHPPATGQAHRRAHRECARALGVADFDLSCCSARSMLADIAMISKSSASGSTTGIERVWPAAAPSRKP